MSKQYKWLIGISIGFSVIVHSSKLWHPLFKQWDIYIDWFLLVVFLAMLVIGGVQLYYLKREKWNNPSRRKVMLLLLVTLIAAWLLPTAKYVQNVHGREWLVGDNEVYSGAHLLLRFKSNNRFTDEGQVDQTTRIHGSYEIKDNELVLEYDKEMKLGYRYASVIAIPPYPALPDSAKAGGLKKYTPVLSAKGEGRNPNRRFYRIVKYDSSYLAPRRR